MQDVHVRPYEVRDVDVTPHGETFADDGRKAVFQGEARQRGDLDREPRYESADAVDERWEQNDDLRIGAEFSPRGQDCQVDGAVGGVIGDFVDFLRVFVRVDVFRDGEAFAVVDEAGGPAGVDEDCFCVAGVDAVADPREDSFHRGEVVGCCGVDYHGVGCCVLLDKRGVVEIAEDRLYLRGAELLLELSGVFLAPDKRCGLVVVVYEEGEEVRADQPRTDEEDFFFWRHIVNILDLSGAVCSYLPAALELMPERWQWVDIPLQLTIYHSVAERPCRQISFPRFRSSA